MHSYVAEARDNIRCDPLFGFILDEETYQEHLASYLTKMLQRISNDLQVTWRRCYNVSGTADTLPEEQFWTYQDVSGTSCKLLEEDVPTYQEHLASCLKKTYNVAGTSCMLLEEDMTAYQERLASHLTKMLRRSRNVLPVCAQEHERYYPTPPHRTPPATDHERAVQCLCLQDRKKDDEVAVPVLAQEHERYLLPHPTPPHR